MENGIVLSKALTKFNTLNQGRLIGVENTGLSQTGKAVGACGMIYLSREEVEAERLAATLPNSATQVAAGIQSIIPIWHAMPLGLVSWIARAHQILQILITTR